MINYPFIIIQYFSLTDLSNLSTNSLNSRIIMLTTLKKITMSIIGITLVVGCSNSSTAKDVTLMKMTEYTKCIVHKNSICKTDLHPNNNLIATGSSGQNVEIWQRNTGQVLQSLKHPDGVPSVKFSPNGNLLATGSYDNNVRIWQVANGELLHTFSGHQGMVIKLAFSPDGKNLASASADNTVRLWNLASGASKTLSAHDSDVWGIAFSPDGKSLLTGGEDNIINVWNALTGEHVKALTDHSQAILDLAFSHNGKLLASGGDDYTIKIWDTTHWQVINSLEDDSYSIYDLTFSHDDSFLVSGGRDKALLAEFFQYHWQYESDENDVTVRIWDVRTGKVLQRLNGHTNDVSNVNLTSDSKTLISSGADGQVVIWDTSKLLNR